MKKANSAMNGCDSASLQTSSAVMLTESILHDGVYNIYIVC